MALWPNYSTFRHRFSVTETIDPLTGYEEWPLDKVRINGFTALTYPRPILTPTFRVTCNSIGGTTTGSYDEVPGADQFNWYVAQRTDDAALQYLTVAPVTGKSGTLQFGVTALANTVFGITANTALGEIALHNLYRGVWIYVQKVNNDAVQLVELLPKSISDV